MVTCIGAGIAGRLHGRRRLLSLPLLVQVDHCELLCVDGDVGQRDVVHGVGGQVVHLLLLLISCTGCSCLLFVVAAPGHRLLVKVLVQLAGRGRCLVLRLQLLARLVLVRYVADLDDQRQATIALVRQDVLDAQLGVEQLRLDAVEY